jgi:uncharacterized protein
MLHNKLPKNIKPRKLCHLGSHQGLVLKGTLLVENASKLSDKIIGQQATAKLELNFGLDESNHCCVRLKGHINLTLLCQRCLQPNDETLELDSTLSPVVGDVEAKALPDNFEPLWAPEDEVDLLQWIEEEILLCLPIVPMHHHECNNAMKDFEQIETPQKSSPFAQLIAQFKR